MKNEEAINMQKSERKPILSIDVGIEGGNKAVRTRIETQFADTFIEFDKYSNLNKTIQLLCNGVYSIEAALKTLTNTCSCCSNPNKGQKIKPIRKDLGRAHINDTCLCILPATLIFNFSNNSSKTNTFMIDLSDDSVKVHWRSKIVDTVYQQIITEGSTDKSVITLDRNKHEDMQFSIDVFSMDSRLDFSVIELERDHNNGNEDDWHEICSIPFRGEYARVVDRSIRETIILNTEYEAKVIQLEESDSPDSDEM